MKNKGNIALILSILTIGYLVFDAVTAQQNQKIGVVQMEKLVYDYIGMKEATKEYNLKMDKWSSQTDSLEMMLKNLYNEMKIDSINGNREKLIKDQKQFYYLQQSYYDFKQNINIKAQQDDEKMTIGVINQLKEHTNKYAKENGYDIIICNTQLQNVGYVNDVDDITEDVLSFSNLKYEGNE